MISVKVDFKKLSKQLGELKTKQLPFATAKTLTRLAQDSREELRKELNSSLTIRSRGLLKKAVIYDRANKKDFPFPESSVGVSKDFDFLSQHATGKTRIPLTRIDGGKYRAVPNPKAIKRTASGKINKKKRPTFLLRGGMGKKSSRVKRPFVLNTKKGQKLIVKRKTKKKTPLIILYKLIPKATIKPEVDASGCVERFVNKNFNRYFGQEISKAIATAKK